MSMCIVRHINLIYCKPPSLRTLCNLTRLFVGDINYRGLADEVHFCTTIAERNYEDEALETFEWLQ